MKKYFKYIFIALIIIVLGSLNMIFSSQASKECMQDYLSDCKKYGYCEGRIYDLKYYNDGKTARHIVHTKNDIFGKDKNIQQMQHNKVIGCLHLSDDFIQDANGTIQCIDVRLYIKSIDLFNNNI